jgi:GntR family transcriptional regulator, N-acetylglucosamine utilization regulator
MLTVKELSVAVDRSSPLPLYHQVREALLAILKIGPYEPGALFPTEQELSERFEVSRITIRRAIDELVREGYLFAKQGKGTFVAKSKIRRHMSLLKSFSEEMIEEGHQPGSKLLALRHERASQRVASMLSLEPDSWVWLVERLRLADYEPICISVAYLNLPREVSLSPAELETRISLWSLLREKDINVSRSDETIQAVAAGPRESELLQIPPGSPLLLVEGTVYSDRDLPIEFHQMYNRGDRYTYSVQTAS